MTTIEVVYEKGVFRPLNPVELPEGAKAEVILTTEPDMFPTNTDPQVGKELAALLDQIADLPYTPDPDGRTDISVRHDEILYPKHGK
jgi:predicted DNA-binding antitoxin AbrB/MazE fold protein